MPPRDPIDYEAIDVKEIPAREVHLDANKWDLPEGYAVTAEDRRHSTHGDDSEFPLSAVGDGSSHGKMGKPLCRTRYDSNGHLHGLHMLSHDAWHAPMHPQPTPLCLDAGATLKKLVDLGQHKAHMPLWNTAVQGVLAGCYIGLGGTLILTVGMSPTLKSENVGIYKLMLGSFGLPFGLLCIVLTGASLFTSNTMYMPLAWYHGKATPRAWAANWFISYFANLVGALLVCGINYAGGVFHGVEDQIVGLPETKAHHEWHQNFLRAILANWCVNLAIWLSTAAQDLTGKFVGIYLPISAFVAMGYEHSIANLFLLPMGKIYGADITYKAMIWNNLIPVTLGNIIAGWIIMATVYTLMFSDFSALQKRKANKKGGCLWIHAASANHMDGRRSQYD